MRQLTQKLDPDFTQNVEEGRRQDPALIELSNVELDRVAGGVGCDPGGPCFLGHPGYAEEI